MMWSPDRQCHNLIKLYDAQEILGEFLDVWKTHTSRVKSEVNCGSSAKRKGNLGEIFPYAYFFLLYYLLYMIFFYYIIMLSSRILVVLYFTYRFLQLIFMKDIRPGSKLFWIFLSKDLFIYYLFRLYWIFGDACRFSLVSVSGGYPLVAVFQLLIAVASLTVEHGL